MAIKKPEPKKTEPIARTERPVDFYNGTELHGTPLLDIVDAIDRKQKVEELIAHLLYEEGKEDKKWESVDEAIFEKYGVDREHFQRIADDLLPLVFEVQSSTTKKTQKAYFEEIVKKDGERKLRKLYP